MELGELAQNFFGALVMDLRRLDGDFDDLVAALVLARVEDAFFAQPELTAVGRAWRDLEQGTAVDGRDLDFGPEAGFADADRHADFDVVAVTGEERVLFHARGDVEIACRRAHGAGVALAGNAQARSVLRARGNINGDGFGARDAAVAMAGGAGVLQFTFAAAARAGQVEFHGPGHLRNLAGAAALRAGNGGAGRFAGTIARRADFVACDVDFGLGASNGLPEIDIERVLEIGAFFGMLFAFLAAPAEQIGEDVGEPAASAAGGAAGLAPACAGLRGEKVREIKSAEVHVVRGLPAALRAGSGETVLGVEAHLVVHLAFLGIAQNVVSFLDVFEALLSGFVVGIEIGVVFARQFPVRLFDVFVGGVFPDPERFVIVVFRGVHSRF